MARVVDRLLAQLPGLQAEPVHSRSSATRFPAVVGGTPVTRRLEDPTPGELIGVWIRVFLGLSLGIMMYGWPYTTTCGLSLFGYLAAVLTVVITGAWAGSAAWKFRSGLAHIVALILVLYGMTLATAELLPRTGYALDQATWLCEEGKN